VLDFSRDCPFPVRRLPSRRLSRRGDGDALDAGVAVVCALPAAVVTLARSTWRWRDEVMPSAIGRLSAP